MAFKKWQISSGLRRAVVVVFLTVLVAVAIWPLNHALAEGKTFESSAVLNLAVPEDIQGERLQEDYLKKEQAQMVSDEVLRPVVDGLNLEKRWSLDSSQAVVILRGKTEVKRLESRGGRHRFEITVQASEAELARSVAAGVAVAYQSQGNAKARRDWEQKLQGSG